MLMDTSLPMIFIKVRELQMVWRATQILDVLIFSRKNVCQSDLTSFLPDNEFSANEHFYKKLKKVGLSGIWTHDHWIPFRH